MSSGYQFAIFGVQVVAQGGQPGGLAVGEVAGGQGGGGAERGGQDGVIAIAALVVPLPRREAA
ncbi:hypothetical protein [Nonomuraea sp. NPDC050202]|uniref:hypothetical protein n=1 Tax=Nonomuraea sp. NPDC050202 TaxID=3155035 RepID=UPI0033F61712